jgi:hypothetical protein
MRDDDYKNYIVKALVGEEVSKEWRRDRYLDWMNHFLTVERFCKYYEIIDLSVGKAVINVGRLIQEEYRAEQHKKRIG